MEFSKKYIHVGYSHIGVPSPWKPIVKKAVIAIEKEIWPRYMPMFIKRWIHYLATDNSVVRVRSLFWNKIRDRLTHGQMICDIKDKYASLRIYGFLSDKCYKIIEQAENECDLTCERCGSTDDVKITGPKWFYNLCATCRTEKNT